jgi:hypothetical protein
MNQFTVPQFIDVEDKIFGPITTRQFVILMVAGLLIFAAYKLADTPLFIFFLAVVGGFAIILAFVKINGQSFHYFLLNVFQTLKRPSLRVWNKSYTTGELNDLRKMAPIAELAVEAIGKQVPAMRIRNLSLMVNTGGYYNGEE